LARILPGSVLRTPVLPRPAAASNPAFGIPVAWCPVHSRLVCLRRHAACAGDTGRRRLSVGLRRCGTRGSIPGRLPSPVGRRLPLARGRFRRRNRNRRRNNGNSHGRRDGGRRNDGGNRLWCPARRGGGRRRRCWVRERTEDGPDGSFGLPSVDSEEAARELVATQDHNPLLDMDTLPFDSSYEAARAAHLGPDGRQAGDLSWSDPVCGNLSLINGPRPMASTFALTDH
jgi:hypothetical protein